LTVEKKQQQTLSACFTTRRVEEYLIRWQKKCKSNGSYVILRLPDVLGPRDSTDRWWFYQMWIQFSSSLQKPVEFSTHLRSSYVYVNDVAHYITRILSQTFIDMSTTFRNQILNIACEEVLSIHDLLLMMIDELHLEACHISIRYNPNTNTDFFPSVTRGGIDITKALSSPFDWQPTPIKQVIRETIQWYNRAYNDYPDERMSVVKRIQRTLLKDDHVTSRQFLVDVNQYSTMNMMKRKREDDETTVQLAAEPTILQCNHEL
jgi:nucleoside-diphosphate-sugar epimerase